MKLSLVLEVVADLASAQWGMFTAAQAANLDVTPQDLCRLVDAGIARRSRHGVYAVAGAPMDAHEDIRAAWLASDRQLTVAERAEDEDPVVVCDESAAAMHSLGDFVGDIHLCAKRRIQTKQPGVFYHRRTLVPAEIAALDGLPVTSPRRTLEDLASGGRWEHDHVEAATQDALNRGIIKNRDIEKSAILCKIVPQLAQPRSHSSVRQRLSADAKARKTTSRFAYNTFFRMLFTHILMQHEGWVLKGGTHIFCRCRNARSTLDLDIFRQGDKDIQMSVDALRSLMNNATIGRYRFKIGEAERGTGEHLPVARVTVKVHDGATTVEQFNIDVSADIVLNDEPKMVAVGRGDSAILPGYPNRILVRLYPIENQIADKLCAMYSTFSSAVSTRYRDLYDLAVMVDQVDFNSQILLESLRTQERARRMKLPEAFVEPAPGWAKSYDAAMSKAHGAVEPFSSYQQAAKTVARALNPSLKALRAIK